MKTILFIAHSPDFYGADKVLFQVIEAARGMYRIHVVLPSHGEMANRLAAEFSEFERHYLDLPRFSLSPGDVIANLIGLLPFLKKFKQFLSRLDPDLVRDLQPGDRIPDGPPGTAEFVVEVADAPHTLVLHSRTHLPPDWSERFGASLDWVWTFSLQPVGDDRTRMLIRNRGWVAPRWLDLGYRALITPADHIMTRGMFRGLEERVRR